MPSSDSDPGDDGRRAGPSPASICERIKSEFAFVKDPRRNHFRHARARTSSSRSSTICACSTARRSRTTPSRCWAGMMKTGRLGSSSTASPIMSQ